MKCFMDELEIHAHVVEMVLGIDIDAIYMYLRITIQKVRYMYVIIYDTKIHCFGKRVILLNTVHTI